MSGNFAVSSSTAGGVETITVTYTAQAINLLFASPASGAAGAPGFRSLVVGDLPAIADMTVLANIVGSTGAPQAVSLTALLDDIFGTTQGSIIFRNAGSWALLPPGTAGYVLSTGGSGANPSWVPSSGGGTWTYGATFPSSPAVGDLCTRSDLATTFRYIYDGTSYQWVNI